MKMTIEADQKVIDLLQEIVGVLAELRQDADYHSEQLEQLREEVTALQVEDDLGD